MEVSNQTIVTVGIVLLVLYLLLSRNNEHMSKHPGGDTKLEEEEKKVELTDKVDFTISILMK